jgi:MoaA/NifB/PqqE/SkfB family radical SAM enzyme
VDSVYIYPVVPSGNLEGFKGLLSVGECAEMAAIAREFNARAPPVAYNPRWLPGCSRCIGVKSAYVSCYGDVTPCGFVQVSYGNVRSEPLAAIWKRMHADRGLAHKATPCPLYHADFRKRFIDSRKPGSPIPCPVEMLVGK